MSSYFPFCVPSNEYASKLLKILSTRVRTKAYQESLKQWIYWFKDAIAHPQLRFIIWMATRRCNLHCYYCVLPQEETCQKELETDEVKRIFSQIATDFDASKITVGITGGEPTLRPDLVEIVKYLVSLGFRKVAVDSNGVNYGKNLSLIKFVKEII